MSAKVIANPIAVLGFQDKGFSTGFAEAGQQFSKFTSGFSTGIGGIVGQVAKFSGIGAIIAGVIGGIGVGALVSGQMEAIDSTAKLSDRLGIATEQLIGLQHAAKLSGVETETLDKGMGFLLKNLADAANGGKETGEAFRALGLDARQLINMPTDQALGMIADSLNGIENPAQKAGIAVKIFGKSGQELLPLLSKGSAGLKAMSEDAEKLGISYSRVDAAKVEKANESIVRLQDVFKGIATQIGISIAPGVEYVADLFTDLGIKVVTVVKNILPPIIQVVGSLFDTIVSYISPIFEWIGENSDAIFGVVAQVVATAIDAVSNIFSGLWSLVSTIFNGIVGVINFAVTSIGESVGIVIGWFGADLPAAFDGTASAIQIIGAVFGWLKDTVIDIVTVITYTIKNWQLVVEIVGLAVAASVVTMANQIAYVLTEVIPGYLTWFVDNWSGIFTDIASFTSTVFANMAENIGNFFSALWSALKGDGFNFQWTGLLDGFTATVKELPKIAEREVGPLEQGLNDQLGKSEQQYQDGLANQVGQQNKLTTSVAATIKNATKATRSIGTGAAPKVGAFNGEQDSAANGKTGNDEGTAIRAGSAEALALRDATFDSAGATAPDYGADVSANVAAPAGARGAEPSTAASPIEQIASLFKDFSPEVVDLLNKILQASPTADATA